MTIRSTPPASRAAPEPLNHGHIALALGLYLFLDWATFAYAFKNFNITPWNPLSGLSLFILYRWGGLMALPVYAMRVLGDLTFRGGAAPLPIVLFSDFVLVVGYLILARWLRRLLDATNGELTPQHVACFLGAALAVIIPMATFYVLILKTDGLIGWNSFPEAVFRRTIGDVIGAATIFPPFLASWPNRFEARLRLRPRHVLQLASTITVLLVIFGISFIDEFKFFYLLFLPIIWTALSDGYTGAAWGVLATQTAMFIVVRIYGEHSGSSVTVLQALMATLATTGLLLGAVVSERQRAVARLRESEQRLRTIFRTIPDALLTVRDSGGIEATNPSALALIAKAPTADGQANINNILPELTWPPKSGHRQLETATPSAEGNDVPVEVTIGRDSDGPQPISVVMVRDISTRKHMEARLAEKQAILTRASRRTMSGELASVIAHEINQPLAAMITYAKAGEMLVEAPGTPPLLKETLEKIAQQAHRSGEIIQRLRDFWGRGEITLTPISLAATVTEATELMDVDLRRLGVRLNVNLPPDLPELNGDRIHVLQVIQNLLRNALDALSGVTGRARRIDVTAVRGTTEVEISVADNGPGVAVELLGTLFQPFSGTKPGGMGLGLSICRSIIEAHGGRLWHEANPNGGAVFRFTLPISPKGR